MTEIPLVGAVFERKPTKAVGSITEFAGSIKSGFPQVQHRSKSVFGRAKKGQRRSASSPLRNPPAVSSKILSGNEATSDSVDADRPSTRIEPDLNDWRRQISEENEGRVTNMTEEERKQEIRDIYEQLGPEVRETVQNIIEARKQREGQLEDDQESLSKKRPMEGDLPRSNTEESIHLPKVLMPIPFVSENRKESPTYPRQLGSPPPALSTSSTRPSSRADRKLRFATVTPEDVHVYESAPTSPRKNVLLLPPPDPSDTSVVSLGQVKSTVIPAGEQSGQIDEVNSDMQVNTEPYEEEGTPEYIRRRFFPDAPAHDPNLAWMESKPHSQSSKHSLRFDLTGAPIPPSISSTLPTHLGLHHHADGDQAGYTLDDIFLLCRSTVPAQRATMLAVLARIARRLGDARTRNEIDMADLAGRECELRKRILAAGLEAMPERGSVGVRAVEVAWQCIVGWDEGFLDIEGVELRDEKESPAVTDAISFIPLEFFLPQVASLLAQMVLPAESQHQLLAILHRLSQESNDIATSIVTTPNLTSTITRIFLLTSIPPTVTSMQPEPSAIQLLITLASSSRTNAVALAELADALLRFVTLLPPDSPYPSPLSVTLLTYTLRFYTTLASYGLCAHIATIAGAAMSPLRSFMASSLSAGYSTQLAIAWATLLEAWTVCAMDPHKTTPSHTLLWSQVTALGWSEDLLGWRESLIATPEHSGVWSAVWQAQAALLEGSRLNGADGGVGDRQIILGAYKVGFESGREKDIVMGALNSLCSELQEMPLDVVIGGLGHIAPYSKIIAAAVRLWLACTPTLSGEPLAVPPFLLPFRQISEVCAQIVKHQFWSSIYSGKADPRAHVSCRFLTTLLSAFLRVSRLFPGVSDDLWIAQALSVLSRSIPGDEDASLHTLEQVMNFLNVEWMTSRRWHVPAVIWERGGLDIIKPFLAHAIRSPDVFIGPLWPSPRSISLSTTQRLPSTSSISKRYSLVTGLPLAKDWVLSPLNHLLRSGLSPVFREMPSPWNANEIEVVRASLLFTKISQTILHSFSLSECTLTREEVVFGCMKVFMLEHDQVENSAFEEVYRDGIVEQLMNDLLAPFIVSSASSVPQLGTRNDLEQVSLQFLGPNMPFYQFYTEFVALYDGISFSHPIFARLLLPPISMRYPPDYRKLLWDDFGHVLRNVRLTPNQVPASGLKEYLWPIEQDGQVIRAYLHSLVNHPLSGFVRLLAIHHIACNIWPDLQQNRTIVDEKGKRLLLAVVEMGDYNTVRELVTYYQLPDGTELPPRCFEVDGDWMRSRLIYVERWGGSSLCERLRPLLTKEA